MRILFQGDSITDAGRDHRDFHNMGNGYPKYAAAMIREAFEGEDIEMINLGIGGTRTGQLFDRLYPDAIALAPDIISILIGINDVWHRYGAGRIATTDAQVEANLRAILARLRTETNAKIVVLAPFLLDSEDKEVWRPEVERIVKIARGVAQEYADVYVPLDEYFAEALRVQPSPQYYSPDGVHPNQNGAELIARYYVEAVRPLVEECLSR